MSTIGSPRGMIVRLRSMGPSCRVALDQGRDNLLARCSEVGESIRALDAHLARRVSPTLALAGLAIMSQVYLAGMGSRPAIGQIANQAPAAYVPPDATAVQPDGDRETSRSDLPTSEQIRLDSGDLLKITVFGREDISGNYRITETGLVRLPTIGSFRAAGKTVSGLEEAIGATIESIMGRRASNVLVDVVEWRPVYVAGLVARPGSYAFAPGMIALQAAILAGGTSPFAKGSPLPVEAMREATRIKTTQELLKEAYARRSRLLAERDGTATLSVSLELASISTPQEADDMMRRQTAILQTQREAMNRDRASLTTAMAEGRSEQAAFEQELVRIKEQRQLRQSAVDTARQLTARGLTTQQRMTDAQVLLATVDRDIQTAIASLARTRRAVEKSERDLAMLTLERKQKIAQDLQSTELEISGHVATIEGASKLIQQVSNMPSWLLTLDVTHSFDFGIVRRQADGSFTTIEGTDKTRLQPGDTVDVTVKRGAPVPGPRREAQAGKVLQ